MDVPVTAGTTIADLTREKLSHARKRLIEQNLRNKLVNCVITSKRAKQIRVVDEIADEVFNALLGSKRETTFAPGREYKRKTPKKPILTTLPEHDHTGTA